MFPFVQRLCAFTLAGAFVRLQLHEVRTGAGEGLVEGDEAEVGAGAAGAGVGSCEEEGAVKDRKKNKKKNNSFLSAGTSTRTGFSSAVVPLLQSPDSEGGAGAGSLELAAEQNILSGNDKKKYKKKINILSKGERTIEIVQEVSQSLQHALCFTPSNFPVAAVNQTTARSFFPRRGNAPAD